MTDDKTTNNVPAEDEVLGDKAVDSYYGENEDYDSDLDLSFLNDEGEGDDDNKDAEQDKA